MERDYLLEAKHIDKSFESTDNSLKVLDNIDLQVTAGEFVCFIGPSGCGKSTFLRILSNLMEPDTGSVKTKTGTKLSFVFQNFGLFPWLTVADNIGFGLKMSGKDQSYIDTEVKKRIAQIGLEGFENRHPRELSGGMKQRVGIARALAVNPSILLLDEPFSALDTFTAEKLRHDLLNIWHENDLTIIMVSHLIEEAVELSNRVIVLSSKPGRIKKEIKIDLPRPRDNRSPHFFKYVDELSALIEQR